MAGALGSGSEQCVIEAMQSSEPTAAVQEGVSEQATAVQAGAGHIEIVSSIGPEDEVCITVSNDGEPIPLKVSEQIFVPFFTTKPDGSGIGLSISRQLMRSNGGTLELLHSTRMKQAFCWHSDRILPEGERPAIRFRVLE